MTSARERAVEAGARALAFECAGHDTFWRSYTGRSEFALRAAFPILAEELVGWHDEQAATYEADELSVMAGFHHDCARALRARIQQMAEAEHE